jgi:RHS repeat-associated protein
LTQQSANVYFLGKLISEEGNAVQVDRLGSVRSGGPGGLGHQAQYPYGVEYTVTANDRERYATYTRDSATGLDYAMNRYYSSQWGRFLSPDPYVNSAGLAVPGSWNRYGYTGNDPVGRFDPEGLLDWDDCPGGSICVFGPPPGPGSGGVGGAGSIGGGGPAPCVAVAGRISIDPFFHPCGSGGGGSKSNPCNPTSNLQTSNLAFVRNNDASANTLSQLYGVPADWILGWPALESSSITKQGNQYGGVAQAQAGDNNFFGLTGTGWVGQTSCSLSVTNSNGSTFACFA